MLELRSLKLAKQERRAIAMRRERSSAKWVGMLGLEVPGRGGWAAKTESISVRPNRSKFLAVFGIDSDPGRARHGGWSPAPDGGGRRYRVGRAN